MSAHPEPRAALRRLARRRALRLARRASADTGVPFLVVGGALRDSLLGLPPGDLDLAVSRESAAAFAAALARLGGVGAVAIGRAPRRILHVPLGPTSVDVWETDGDPADDLARRDFTVNALGLAFPGARLLAPGPALEDLRARRLSLPRDGVLLEDPLRVARAARFLERLPGFRLDPTVLPELLLAAPRLESVAPERRLAELDAILSAGPSSAARALRRLEEWGALRSLLPGVPEVARRRGLRLLRRAGDGPGPGLLRTLLLAPAGPDCAGAALAALRASRRDQRLTESLLALPRPPDAPSRRDAVLLLRRAAPFSREAVEYVAAAHGSRGRSLAREAAEVLSGRNGLEKALRPRRPFLAEEVARITGAQGSALGRALAALDEALATGEVRGRRQAGALLRTVTRRRGPGTRPPAGTV